MRNLITLLWLALPTLAFGQAPPKPFTPPVIELKDQFGQESVLTETKGDVVVLIYGDRKSATSNSSLGETLHVRFHPTASGLPPKEAQQQPVKPIPNWPAGVRLPDVRVIPVACIGKLPRLVANIIRNQIRRASPDVPVYLDFENKMKKGFGLASGVSNVIVIDTQGQARYRSSANYNDAQILYLEKLIEYLRAEAR